MIERFVQEQLKWRGRIPEDRVSGLLCMRTDETAQFLKRAVGAGALDVRDGLISVRLQLPDT